MNSGLTVKKEEMKILDQWLSKLGNDEGKSYRGSSPETTVTGPMLPVSFKYNEMTSQEWFNRWGMTRQQQEHEDCTTHSFICADTDTGLECVLNIQQYKNCPVCLWNLSFENKGQATTPVVEDVNVLDMTWAACDRKDLYCSRGSFHYDGPSTREQRHELFRENFELIKDDLIHKKEIIMGAVGGRSSVDWMPYFNFSGDGEGLVFGIGWTGQWQSKINLSGEDRVAFRAGMEQLHTVLHPGEKMRQPSIMMVYWKGDDYLRGQNLLRRFITDIILPRYDGKPVQAPAAYPTWGGMIAENHLKRIDHFIAEDLPYDYYWIDAGWYGTAGPNKDEFSGEWGTQAGNWTVNRETYPDGFYEISDRLHKAGKKFLLWFEPERAINGTPVTEVHPEYFLGEKSGKNALLLNMGNPEARSWCTELVADMIEEYGIDCYRQDFNISPLPYWQKNDTPDRIGMTEIKYIEGLYTHLDELRERFPSLLIDNCASGGRRLDFEMMRRSIPLWASDMQCFPNFISEMNQHLVQGLLLWLPQFSFGTQMGHSQDTYHFRSTMAGGIVPHLYTYEANEIDPDYPYQWLRDRLNEYHRAKVYFSGNFYPLIEQQFTYSNWSAYQLDHAGLNGGLVMVFRKKDSPFEKATLNLRELDPEAMYELENVDRKDCFIRSGQDLMINGITLELGKRESALFFYKVKRKQ